MSIGQFTGDDVIGCVEVSLNRLRDGPLVGWNPIVRPMMHSLGVLGQIWNILTGPQPKAELKMIVSLEVTDDKREFFLEMLPLRSESNLLLGPSNDPEMASMFTLPIPVPDNHGGEFSFASALSIPSETKPESYTHTHTHTSFIE